MVYGKQREKFSKKPLSVHPETPPIAVNIKPVLGCLDESRGNGIDNVLMTGEMLNI
jgi:hypothetical protein